MLTRQFGPAVAAALLAAIAGTACTGNGGDDPSPTPAPTTTSPTPSPSLAALPTMGLRVLASAEGTGQKTLAPVDAAKGFDVVVSCVGTSVEIVAKGAFRTTHDCGDGSVASFAAGSRAGSISVQVIAETGTRWRVAVLPAA